MSTAHTIAATRKYRGMPCQLMAMTEFLEVPAVQSYFGLTSIWLASSNVGVGGTWLWTAGSETGIAVPPFLAAASEITVKQCALYSGFNWFSSADSRTELYDIIEYECDLYGSIDGCYGMTYHRDVLGVSCAGKKLFGCMVAF